MQHDVKEIAVFGSASEGFSQKNIGCSMAESLERFEDVVATALDHGIKVRGYISCVCGCPYDGAVSPQNVTKVIIIVVLLFIIIHNSSSLAYYGKKIG